MGALCICQTACFEGATLSQLSFIYPVFTYLEYLEETDVIIQTSLNETSTGTYLDPLTTIAMEWG
jgi:hypothetical protein